VSAVETVPSPIRGRSRYEGFRATIKAVGTGRRGWRDLSFEEAREAALALLSGASTDAQAGAFLVAMRIKGETPAEMAGLAQGMRDTAVALECPTARPVVVSGGAYDGVAAGPALSLAAAAGAAGAGAGMVLHCGRRLGPKYGTTPAEVLAELGGPAAPSAADSERMLARSGLTLVYTPHLMPGWDRLADVRDDVGVRGPLHSAERLIDWFGARRFVATYTHGQYADLLLEALRLLGAHRTVASRGIEGSDVLRPGKPTARCPEGELDLPAQPGLGLDGDPGPEASAEATWAVLSGAGDPAAARAVCLSAGVALWVAGLARHPRAGVAEAEEALRDGRAARSLDAMLNAAH